MGVKASHLIANNISEIINDGSERLIGQVVIEGKVGQKQAVIVVSIGNRPFTTQNWKINVIDKDVYDTNILVGTVGFEYIVYVELSEWGTLKQLDMESLMDSVENWPEPEDEIENCGRLINMLNRTIEQVGFMHPVLVEVRYVRS